VSKVLSEFVIRAVLKTWSAYAGHNPVYDLEKGKLGAFQSSALRFLQQDMFPLPGAIGPPLLSRPSRRICVEPDFTCIIHPVIRSSVILRKLIIVENIKKIRCFARLGQERT
jgi:hypothetical protein